MFTLNATGCVVIWISVPPPLQTPIITPPALQNITNCRVAVIFVTELAATIPLPEALKWCESGTLLGSSVGSAHLILWRTGTSVEMGDGGVVQKAFASSREQLLQLQGKCEPGRQERENRGSRTHTSWMWFAWPSCLPLGAAHRLQPLLVVE